MSRDVVDYLQDILENIDIAQKFVADLSYPQFREDQRTVYAVIVISSRGIINN